MSRSPIIHFQEVSDPEELADAQKQREQFDRNSAWLQANIPDIYSQHRGKFICIAGEELFVAESSREAIAKARAAHPEDAGWFTRYIPVEKVPQVYAV
mgnify:CR=1 FL=1